MLVLQRTPGLFPDTHMTHTHTHRHACKQNTHTHKLKQIQKGKILSKKKLKVISAILQQI